MAKGQNKKKERKKSQVLDYILELIKNMDRNLNVVKMMKYQTKVQILKPK